MEYDREDIENKVLINNISAKKLSKMDTEANMRGCTLNDPNMYKMYELNEGILIFIVLIVYLCIGIVIGSVYL